MFNSARAFSELEKSGAIPEGKLLFVNSIGSQALNSKENEELNRSYGHLLPRLVLEITEEEDLDPDALERKRRSVKTFALDDYGSGYNNEKSLLAISPAFIKMDLAIIRGINSDVDKQQIVSNTVGYAHRRGMKVVAEGLERASDMKMCISLGVDLLQGFYLACPASAPGDITPEALKLIHQMNQK